MPAAAGPGLDAARDLLRAPGRRAAGALVGGLAFILPGLLMVLAIAALALRRRAAGAGSWAIGAARARRSSRWSRRPGSRSAAARSPGARDAARAGVPRRRASRRRCSPARASCSCCSRRASLELAWRGARGAALHAWPVAARRRRGSSPGLAWTALKVGALSYGGGFVIIPLMQADAVDAARLDDRRRVRQRRRLRAAHAGPGDAHGRARRLGGGGRSAARCSPPRSRSRRRSSSIAARRRALRPRCARTAAARAFLDGAGPAAVGAILGAAVPLAAGLGGGVAGRGAGRRRRAAGARPPAAAGRWSAARSPGSSPASRGGPLP